jgi:hypothetical protein
LNTQVSRHLGDSLLIVFKAEPLAPPVTRPGFLEFFGDEGGAGGVNAIRRQWKLKIDKAELPEGLAAIHTITNAPKLAGLRYRPAADTLDAVGDSLVCDLQRAP